MAISHEPGPDVVAEVRVRMLANGIIQVSHPSGQPYPLSVYLAVMALLQLARGSEVPASRLVVPEMTRG